MGIFGSIFDPEPGAKCKVCGCTDDRACEGGCSWATLDRNGKKGVCSNCVGKPVKRLRKKTVKMRSRSR